MKKTYKTPKMLVIELDQQDIVCTSDIVEIDIVEDSDGVFDAKRRSSIWDE